MLRVPKLFLPAALVLLTSAPSLATTLLELDDGELIDRSALIVTGSCDGATTEWRAGTLVTVAAVTVDRVLKGEQTERIELLIPGGVDLDREIPVTVTFPGAPSVTPGERVLLFLTPTGATAGEYTVTGFSQGKYSIVETPEGTPVVRRDLQGVSLVRHDGVHRGDRRAVPLEVLEERIARRGGHHDASGTH